MERTYCVELKKTRCGERYVFVNDVELLVLILKDEIKDRCELILEPGYVIKTDLTTCYKAILGGYDNEIWRRCGEEPTCMVSKED